MVDTILYIYKRQNGKRFIKWKGEVKLCKIQRNGTSFLNKLLNFFHSRHNATLFSITYLIIYVNAHSERIRKQTKCDSWLVHLCLVELT